MQADISIIEDRRYMQEAAQKAEEVTKEGGLKPLIKALDESRPLADAVVRHTDQATAAVQEKLPEIAEVRPVTYTRWAVITTTCSSPTKNAIMQNIIRIMVTAEKEPQKKTNKQLTETKDDKNKLFTVSGGTNSLVDDCCTCVYEVQFRPSGCVWVYISMHVRAVSKLGEHGASGSNFGACMCHGGAHTRAVRGIGATMFHAVCNAHACHMCTRCMYDRCVSRT